jgi:hypothetical protein
MILASPVIAALNTSKANTQIITDLHGGDDVKNLSGSGLPETEIFMQAQFQIEKLNICKWWLDRGFYLLPAQVGKKYLLQGWGQYQQKITTWEGAVHCFDTRQSNCNIAVLANDAQCVLDFDDTDLYTFWANKHPEISRTYTERTPRGGAHVFFSATVPAGLVLVPGVEIKKICIVHPSVVGDRQYARGEGEIIQADASLIFSSLSKPGHKTPYLLRIEQDKPRRDISRSRLIEQIKAHWNTVQVFRTYRPDIEFYGSGVIVTARCPFHEDHKPSMFINTDTGFWKCHACGVYGDVINAYAHLQGIDNHEAILRMSRALGVTS